MPSDVEKLKRGARRPCRHPPHMQSEALRYGGHGILQCNNAQLNPRSGIWAASSGSSSCSELELRIGAVEVMPRLELQWRPTSLESMIAEGVL